MLQQLTEAYSPVPQGTGGGNSQIITPDASYVASGGARGESALTGLAPGMFGAGGAGGSTAGPSWSNIHNRKYWI